MPARHRDWLQQARNDLELARTAAQAEHHEWAAFAAQQAAEKAIKALLMFLGAVAWGHDVTHLLNALPAERRPPEDLVDRARNLDRHYLPARYPNGFDAGTPRDHYSRKIAHEAIADAEAIVEFCDRSISR
jgi:HEPN domain-containing protein